MLSENSKYKAIFDVAPIPIWEEDFSEIKNYLDELDLMGKSENSVRNKLLKSPEIINACISKLRILNFNLACLELHKANSKQELLESFHKLILPETGAAFLEQIVGITQGKHSMEMESKMMSMDGSVREIYVRWKVVPGFEDSLKEVLVTTEDISSTKSQIEKQKETEQKLNDAQKIAKVGYFEFDPATEELFWSEEVYHIWEMDPEKSKPGKIKLWQSIHPDDRKNFQLVLKKALSGEINADFKYRIITSEGNTKWIKEKGSLKYDQHSKTEKYKGTIQDVTEEEVLRQGLKELLKRYHLVSKATSEIIYDWDLVNGSIFWGEGLRSQFGYHISSSSVNLDDFGGFIHPEDESFVRESMNNFFKSKDEFWQGEYRFKKSDGSYATVIDKGYGVRNSKGKIERMVGALQDITEIKKTTEDLKQRNHFIQTTIDNLPIGIAVNSIDSGQVTLMNKKFAEIYGWPMEDLNNIPSFFEKVYPDPVYRKQLQERILADVESGIPEKMNWSGIEITTKEGKKKIVTAKNIPVYDQGLMISTVIDETEKYKAEKELEKINERFLYATHAVSDAIWDWNLESETIFWGNGYKTLFGYPLETNYVTQDAWEHAIHPEDRIAIVKSITAARKDKSVSKWEGEYRFKKYCGEYAFVKEKTIILRNDKGKPVRMVGALQDISEQKRTEELIAQERNLLRTLIDNIPDYIYVKDKDFKHLINNKANVQLIGKEQESETIGKTVFDLFPSDFAELFHADDLKVMKHKEPVLNREEPIIDGHGQVRILSTSKLPLKDPEGKVFGLVGISRDITENKDYEKSLLYKTKLLETITSVVKLLLFNQDWLKALEECLELIGKAIGADRVYFFKNYTDAESGKLMTRQLVEWNDPEVSSELENPDYQKLSLDDFPEFLTKAYKKEPFVTNSKNTSGPLLKILSEQNIKSIIQFPIFIRKDFFGYIGFDYCKQERFWSDEEISFLKTLTSNIEVAIERAQNLESLKALNEKLQQSNHELGMSNKELEQFAYVASHDLQEPLRMITSFLSMIERKYAEQLDDKGVQYIRFAVEGAMRMKSIILDLLEYSRVGRIHIPSESINLNLLLEEITSLFQTNIEENKAKLIWSSLPTIKSQRPNIRQVLQNLISNALKYKSEDRDPIVEIKTYEEGDIWHFEVADNGLGIAEEYHKKIFIIFQRLHGKEKYSGTGIGLAICKKIIENLGGKIWVESSPDQGSIFHFTVPKKHKN
ncbi:Phytochrome, two-component sensor histidine kinase [Indibacter alkaliphilus LW1]|uniref:histidine kinase n=1 Tax=Indibacter alkaliphilus (strain CCUG 57479 / KCTC 22604 / LW1) TaxID=1189612 RepID=S2DTJ7_INDAL|nr:PAS domain-containing protein [Indibacter alkaliphilus]EOZ95421.1 Phytochrome, two-component sensor histidine kinase [Indibacter alkaliphilus LW1]